MPAIQTSIEQSKRKLVKNILEGNYSSYLGIAYLRRFLNKLFLPQTNEMLDLKRIGINLTDTTESNFIKINNILSYINECLNSAGENIPLDIINDIRTLNAEIRELLDLNDVDNNFYEIIFSSIKLTENVVKHLSSDNEIPKNTYYGYLNDEVKKLGNLILELRTKGHEYNIIEKKVADLINATQEIFSPVEQGNIRYGFVSQYHQGRSDIETVCQELFNTTECYFPDTVNGQYHAIVNGNLPSDTQNAHDILEQLLSNTTDLKLLSTSENGNVSISNFLSYFLAYVTQLNSQLQDIPESFIDHLALLIRELPDVFKETKPNYAVYNNLFSLVTAVLKNKHITTKNFYVFSPAIHACKELIIDLFQHPADLNTTIKLFYDIFYQINKLVWINPEHKLDFASDLLELNLICLNQEACNANFTLNQFNKVLGTMVHSIPSNSTVKAKLEEIAQSIFQAAQNKFNKTELEGFARSFLGSYVNETHIPEKCASLFDFNCTPSSSNIAPSVNNTTFTKIVNNTTATHITHDSDILTRNTDSKIITQDTNPLTLGSTIGTAIGLGTLAGSLNGSSQLILHIAKRKNCSIKMQQFLAVTLAFANAFGVCTLPLIYSIVEDLAKGDDPDVNSQKILNCIYAFLTSIFLQGINQVVQHYCKPSILKNIFNLLPLFAVLWVMVYGEEGMIKNFYILTTLATAMGVSIAVNKGGKKLYSFFNSTSNEKYDSKENSIIEMEPLNTGKTMMPVNGTLITDTGTIEKTYQYIKLETLDKTRKESDQLLKKLENLQFLLDNSIESNKKEVTSKTPPKIAGEYQEIIDDKLEVLKKIKNEIDILKKLFSFLNEDIHNEACKSHTDKKNYLSAMEKLGNVCKLLKPNLINLKNTLSEISGYIKAKKESFSEMSDIEDIILDIMKYVDFPLSSINLCLERYNVAEIAEKAEKRGVKKALSNHQFFEKLTEHNSLAPRRPTRTRLFSDTRCQSASDSKTNSSSSEEGSVISTGSSKDNENAQIVRSLLKV